MKKFLTALFLFSFCFGAYASDSTSVESAESDPRDPKFVSVRGGDITELARNAVVEEYISPTEQGRDYLARILNLRDWGLSAAYRGKASRVPVTITDEHGNIIAEGWARFDTEEGR
jgi:hypothetical protein